MTPFFAIFLSGVGVLILMVLLAVVLAKVLG